jgi:hypothetical protein
MPVSVSHALSATTPDNNQYEIRPSHWNSNHIATVSVVGSEISGAFGNAGGVSFGYDGTNVTAAAPAGAPSPVIVTAGTSQGTLGTIVFSNSNGMSFGLNGSTITGTVATNYQSQGAYLTTARASNDAIGTNTAQSNVTWTANSSGLSLDARGYAGTGTSATNASITLNSLGLAISVATQAAAPVNFSAGTTSNNLGSVVFSNANGVSFGLNGSTITGTVATNYDLLANTTNYAGIGETVGTIAGTDLAMTVNTAGVSIGYPKWITTAMASNAATISNIKVSAGTSSTNLSALTFSNSNGVSFGLNGSVITASAAAAAGFVVNDGANSITSGTAVFSDANNFSFGINGQTITGSINVSNLTVAGNLSQSSNGSTITISALPWNIYAVGNTTQSSSGTMDAATVSMRGTGGVSVGVSNGSIVISGATGGGAGGAAVSIGGNSTSAGAGYSNITSGTAVFMGGNNITLSQNGASITISGANVGGAQTGISGIQNSQTTYTSGSVALSEGGGAITIASTTGQKFLFSVPQTSSLSATGNASISTNGSTISIGANAAAVSLSGNSTSAGAGYSNVSTGTLILAGGNNITLSQNGASVTISGANAGGAQTGISGLQVSNTTYTSGTVTFQNANGISFGSSGANGISASYTVPTITSWTVSDQNTSATVGRLAFTASNGLTLSLSTSNNGNHTVIGSYTVPTQTNQSAIKGFGVSNTGQTAGNTGISTGIDWVLAGSNSITLSQSTAGGGPNTVWIQHPAWITTADLSQNSSNYVRNWKLTGNTAGTTSSAQGTDLWLAGGNNLTISGSSNSLSFSVGNYITTARASNDAIGTNTAQTNVTWTVNSSGLSLNAGGYAGTSTGFTGAGISGSMTHNTSGLALSLSVPATSSIVGVNGISVSTAGSTISILPQWVSSYENSPAGLPASTVVTLNGASISQAVPFYLPENGSFSFLRIPVAMTTNSTTIATTGASLSASAACFSTWNAVVYSLGTGASSKSLTSVASGSVGWTVRNSISVAANGTQYSVTQGLSGNAEGGGSSRSTQYSISNTNYSFTTNQIFTEWSGSRFIDINFANSLTAGAYWLIFGLSTSSATNSTGMGPATNCNVGYSNHYANSQPNIWFGVMGSTNLTSGGLFGGGSFSTAGGGTTAALPISAISSSASNNKPYFQLLRSA